MATSLPETADGERLSNPSVGKKAKMLQKDFPLLFSLPIAPLDGDQCMCNSEVHSSERQSRQIRSHFTTKPWGAEGTDVLLVPVLPRFSWESPSAWRTVTPWSCNAAEEAPSDPACSANEQIQSRCWKWSVKQNRQIAGRCKSIALDSPEW